MPLYESTFIVRQDMSTQEVDKVVDSFSKIVNDNKGKVIKKEYWGLRNLAYKVSKNKKGHYVFLGVDTDADTVSELQRQFKLSEDVVRNLIVKVDGISKDASPIMGKRAPLKRTVNKDNKDRE